MKKMLTVAEKILDSDLMEKVMLTLAHIGMVGCVVCLIIELTK